MIFSPEWIRERHDSRQMAERLERQDQEIDRLQDQLNAAVKAHRKETERRHDAETRLWAVRMVKAWTNEDGRRFVFADDLLAATDPDIHQQVQAAPGRVG